ncbi:MAG: SOUL family heme-binding protein [Alphaproteobacteria bacterium]
MRKKHMWWIIAGVAAVGMAAWGPIVSNVEQAKYEVVESHGDMQIRDYAPMIVAEAEVSGERTDAINQGFSVIADYIFGNNAPKQNVAMTSPVIQQPAEKIAMTAPVIQEGTGNRWKVRFVMPASYTMDTLPKPNNEAVTLHEVPSKRFAVIRFSGMAGEDSLKEYTHQLNAFIKDKKLEPLSEATYAFFNPPWTLPFLRRNEVMIEIKK